MSATCRWFWRIPGSGITPAPSIRPRENAGCAANRKWSKGYLEIGRLARAGKRALLACDWDRLAELMNRNHAIVRDLGGSGEANETLDCRRAGKWRVRRKTGRGGRRRDNPGADP